MSTKIFNYDEDLPSIDKLSRQTVTSVLSCGPPVVKSPQDAADILFNKPLRHLRPRINHEILEHEITENELDIAANFGRFPYRPSELFLKLFHNVLCTLRRDPLAGRVSPSLIGSSGVIPLTIISTIPDIMQHYYHCIIHAKKEVLLATNFWEKSESVNIIGKALRDLSKRAGDENRQIIVKLMIDHPTKENITHFHNKLPPSKWSDYDIPLPNEIPNISLEVNNYHRVIMGTFHAKFMIVDRRIALLNSNNIQDRPNLEMMSHFEGDIVNSFYDTYLISWWIPFEPNIVCLKDEAHVIHRFKFGINNSKILSIKQPLRHAIARARLRLQCHLETEESDVYLHAPLASEEDENFILTSDERKANGNGFSTVAIQALVNHRRAHSPSVLVKATNNLAGAVIGYDLTPRSQSPLTHHLNKSSKSAHETRSDENLSNDELEKLASDFSPFIFHEEHKPIPIALVNRLPRGTPGHTDTANPQDAAWMGAFRYAKKSIFIQSPTLNASPAIEGIISACRRGVIVTLWLDLGFNDLVEGFGTFQGGTNESVVKKLYKKLKDGNDGSENYLEVFWYTGKDQARPLNFSQKKRNCHIKFMSIDDQVAIMGNGNMDTQSWFHSQEINAMVDSPVIVKEWMDALYKNQSTHKYGRVDLDGNWRDDKGNLNPNNGR
ncbi:unnamed protein product [Adineta steineri]|uniref:PLD phosphodiesterase domain-containing protein n=1 Tax=Adineta steineri TaxID=433720 RepID=A0A814D424_9BILA|nr:unnamed protein product [Adineta steineri]CAF1417558.1 unnamed protein product [Adineta steineri]